MYCYGGRQLPYTTWSSCPEELELLEESSTTATNVVHTFLVSKNAEIDNGSTLTLDSSTYNLIGIFRLESGEDYDCGLTDKASSFEFLNSGENPGQLNVVGEVDYEECSFGFKLKVQAVNVFTGCVTGNVNEATCGTQLSEICEIVVRVKNINEPPEWVTPQVTDATADCYAENELLHGEFLKFEVPEKSPEFSEFGQALETCVTDPDATDTVLFSLKNTTEGSELFDVSACGGQLFVKEGAELKYTFGATNENKYSVVVQATDAMGAFDSTNVTIQMTNVNDVPVFDNLPEVFTIEENSAAYTALSPSTSYASDEDGNEISYSLTYNENDAFVIDATYGTLSASRSFNFEEKSAYYIKIAITDSMEGEAKISHMTNGNSTNSTHTTNPTPVNADSALQESDLIKVQITDTNDVPYFAKNANYPIVIEFPEITTTSGTIIGDLTAYAVDDDRSDTLENNVLAFKVYTSYDATSQTGTESPDFDVFMVGSNAKLRVLRDTGANPFDYEGDENVWDLKLTLEDASSSSAPVDLTLRLSNVNEAPAFETETSSLSVTVMETVCASTVYSNDEEGTMVEYKPSIVNKEISYVEAVEIDVGQALNLNLGTDNTPFRVGNSEERGNQRTRWPLILNEEIDFEGSSSTSHVYTFDLIVSDGQLSATQEYSVTVLDCNESPVLVDDSATVTRTINENVIGAVSGAPISVVDLDGSDGISYEKVGGNGLSLFDVDSSGVVTSIIAPDYEDVNIFFLELKVVDDPSATGTSLGEPSESTVVRYRINVVDVNENPTMSDETFVVTEPTRRASVVSTITVDDVDMGDVLGVEIVEHGYVRTTAEGETCIEIDGVEQKTEAGACCELSEEVLEVQAEGDGGKSFSLKVKDDTTNIKPFNNMGGCDFILTAKATDSGGLESSVVTFTMQIRGSNNAPEIADQTFSDIPENSPEGTVIIPGGDIIVTDDDAEDTMQFYLIRGEGEEYASKFMIHRWTGELRVTSYGASQLNFEENPTITLTVGVRDGNFTDDSGDMGGGDGEDGGGGGMNGGGGGGGGGDEVVEPVLFDTGE